MFLNVQYSNDLPSHVTTIWIPETPTVRYSNESGFQVFGIQMVTVQYIIQIWSAIRR